MPIITIVVTILLLIFGEITPKTLALKQPERLAVVAGKFISPMILALTPDIFLYLSYLIDLSIIF